MWLFKDPHPRKEDQERRAAVYRETPGPDLRSTVRIRSSLVAWHAPIDCPRAGDEPVPLEQPQLSKEHIARRIAAEDGITHGPVCVLTCVEPCRSFEIYRNRDTKHLQLQPRVRKCLFLYHYAVHPVFGFLNARIQTWFPFSIQICVNGREWLAHQRDAVGLAYLRHDNCFPWIEDWPTAQQLMDQQLKSSGRRCWTVSLGR